MADQEVDQNVQVFKIKRLIRNLEKARGNGTSMISLIIPPKEQVAKQQKVIIIKPQMLWKINFLLDVGWWVRNGLKYQISRQSTFSTLSYQSNPGTFEIIQ